MKIEDLHAAVLRGDAESVANGVSESLQAGADPEALLKEALIPAMIEVGDMFERGEAYVPEMLIAARAMQAGMQVLKPELISAGVEPVGRIALGTVLGDIHDIGKNLVGMMMEGAGFEVVDLGVDVPTEKFVELAQSGVNILGMSGLLTTTIPAMPVILEALEKANVRDKVKVIVGGAPVTEAFADKIGADGYAPDAASAVRLAKKVLGIA